MLFPELAASRNRNGFFVGPALGCEWHQLLGVPDACLRWNYDWQLFDTEALGSGGGIDGEKRANRVQENDKN